jgi:hypothetical protein
MSICRLRPLEGSSSTNWGDITAGGFVVPVSCTIIILLIYLNVAQTTPTALPATKMRASTDQKSMYQCAWSIQLNLHPHVHLDNSIMSQLMVRPSSRFSPRFYDTSLGLCAFCPWPRAFLHHPTSLLRSGPSILQSLRCKL